MYVTQGSGCLNACYTGQRTEAEQFFVGLLDRWEAPVRFWDGHLNATSLREKLFDYLNDVQATV